MTSTMCLCIEQRDNEGKEESSLLWKSVKNTARRPRAEERLHYFPVHRRYSEIIIMLLLLSSW